MLWDNAHYTKNDNYALIVGALKKEGGDSRIVDFDGKVENPWLEAKTKHVPELLVLKREIKKSVFGRCMNRQRMLVDNSITSYARHVSRNGSQDGDDHIPLISFVYHYQSFLLVHFTSEVVPPC